MIKIESTEVVGWEPAIRGMRNPMNSWDKSDSLWLWNCVDHSEDTVIVCDEGDCKFSIGPNDHKLMLSLANSGSDHRKFMRMLNVYVDVTAPLYWWKEMDTYRHGVEKNSCSTMHKIHEKEFTMENFSCEHLDDTVREECIRSKVLLVNIIDALNYWRDQYLLYNNELKAQNLDPKNREDLIVCRKNAWWQMVQLLPSSYNQRRTMMFSYEALRNIYHARCHHKLDEWIDFCNWIKELPFSELITGKTED